MRREEKMQIVQEANAMRDWVIAYQNQWTEALSHEDYSTLEEMETTLKVYIGLCVNVEPGLAPLGWFKFKQQVEFYRGLQQQFNDQVRDV